jgi:hypothetical protein
MMRRGATPKASSRVAGFALARSLCVVPLRTTPAPIGAKRAQVAAGRRRIALVAPTAADARDVICEGESDILAVSPPLERAV